MANPETASRMETDVVNRDRPVILELREEIE
jgi:hypothetical protein